MEKLIHITDQETFNQQLKMLIREELSIFLSSTSPAPQQEKWLTREDVMQLLKICPATLWARMKDGTIKYFKIGRRVYFKESDVNNSLKVII